MKFFEPSRIIPGLAAVAAAAIGLFTLAAWGLGKWQWVTLGGSFLPVAPVSAVLFILLALALSLRHRFADRPAAVVVARLCAATTALVATAEMLRAFRWYGLPWDYWGPAVEWGFGRVQIGRAAPICGFVFLLTVSALGGSNPHVRVPRLTRQLSRLAGVLGVLSASVIILAYAAGTPLGYGDGGLPMPWLTALGLLILNGGILAGAPAAPDPVSGPDGGEVGRWEAVYGRQLVLLPIAIFILSGLAGFYYLRRARGDIREQWHQQLEVIANLKVDQLMQWRRERLGDAGVLAVMPDLPVSIAALARDPTESGVFAQRLATYLDTMQRSYGYRQVAVFGPDLKPLFVSSGVRSIDTSLSADVRAVIRDVREPLMNELSETNRGRIHLDFLAAVRTASGEFAGAVQLTVDASVMLFPLLHAWPMPSDTGESILVRPDGEDVLYLSELRGRPGSALRRRAPITSPTLVAAMVLRGSGSGLLEGTDHKGAPVLAVSRRIAGTPWVVISKIDQAEAFAPLRDELASVIAGMALITALAGLYLRNVRQERLRHLGEQELRRERASRATNERLAYLMQNAGEVILLFDQDMRIIEANQRVLEVYGRRPEEMINLTAKDLRAPQTLDRLDSDFAAVQAGATRETLHQRKDGTTFPVEVTARRMTIDGRPHVLCIVRDISVRKRMDDELARVSRLYHVMSEVNKMLLHVKTPNQLFNEVCDVLVRVGGFRMAWVGWPDGDSGWLRPLAVAGDNLGYTHGIRVSVHADVPEGRGPAGRAWREERVVVCNDFLGDQTAWPWRDRALQSGCASLISLPFRAEGRLAGVLNVYAAEKDFFAAREIRLLEETVDNIAFGLEAFAQEARREAVEAERRKLSLAVEQSPTSVVITDLDGNIEYVNPRFTEVTGYARTEILGQNPRILKSGLTPNEVYVDLWQTITRGEQWRGEITNLKKDGSTHIEQVLIAPVKDTAGRTTHYLALKEDITQRKQVEAALVESEARIRRVLAMVPVPLAHSDGRGNVTYVNEPFHQTFGYRVEEVPTIAAWMELAYPDPQYRAQIGAMWAEAVAVAAQGGREIPPKECQVTCLDGEVRSVEISGVLLGGEMLIMLLDVTERVRANKKMRQMMRIIEQAPLSIAITDLAGRIEYVNPAFSQLTGYSEAELLGQNPRVLKSGLTSRETYADMWATITAGAVWRGELSNRKKNGEIHQERVVIAPVTDETGRVTHYAAVKEDITKAKQVEDELLASNERFRALFESNLDGLLITVAQGGVLAANPAACAILRRTEAEICALGRGELVDPADTRLAELTEERARTGRARGTLTMIRGDGTRFEAEVSSALFGSGPGERAGIVIRDITDRLRAEQALRESEARFRELFDLESDAIIVYAVDSGRVIQANQAAVQLYGVSMEQMLQTTILDQSADPEATKASWELMAKGADQYVRVPRRQHRRSDGTVFPVDITMRSFRRDGQLMVVGVIREITEQVRAQEQMQRFNEELEAKVLARTEEIARANREMHALLQSIPDLVMRVNRAGSVLSFQPALGVTPLARLERADVQETADGMGAALRALVLDAGAKALAENAVVSAEHELPHTPGPVAVELRAAPVTREDFVVFVRDVSARKRFEAEMAAMLEKEHQVSEMKTRFISVTSHEFRTPMAAALGSVELLANHLDNLNPAKRQELLARISQSLFRMTEMLDEILLLNRMDANRIEIRLGPVEVPQFVRNLIEEIKMGDRVGHVFDFECTGSTTGFVSDTSLLHHILGNILSNAVRYSASGTRVSVRVTGLDGHLRFSVEDQGIGIPAEDLKRIFEPFERASNVGNIKGTGLGLNIVRRMADMLHGELNVRSSPTGSCFEVTFPRTPTSAPPP